jgi:hypothetical protein
MIHTPFCVGRGVLAEPGNGHDELSISRTIMSSVIRIAMAGSYLTGRSGKPAPNQDQHLQISRDPARRPQTPKPL